ncbi:VOC family protein [[Mycobacterium] burgundiense]|uniref:VOC family protein n=1 Tax=[Mycobacterium] burgundiense TaxID=3064286 RepID=A0ABM9LCG7_9MYCO|nr:VOC family protein [Mycolicibacterium sp. MU0053]CAJ1496707.1 VOC family protein [Mycolicibacterium sp. MU0053]
MTIDNTPMLVPHLVVDDAAAAIDFYVRAFNATEEIRMPGPDGKIIHACVTINGHPVFLNDDFPETSGGKSMTPTALGGASVTLHLHGPDVDGRFKRAVDAGATAVAEPEDQFWGDRYALVRDPFGHQWSLAESVREVAPADIAAHMNAS